MIVLWGSASDRPVRAVHEHLVAGRHRVVLLDQLRSEETDLELRVEGGAVRGTLTQAADTVQIADITALYARPQPAPPAPWPARDDGPTRGAGHRRRLDEALGVLWAVLPGLVVNRPAAMAPNGSKPLQLEMIRAAGFSVPETLVTTDPEELEAFRSIHRRLIYKSVSAVRSVVTPLTEAHAERYADLSACPTQFQAWVPGVDVRVHVVGDEVFATEVTSDATDYRYPRDADVQLRATTLPGDVDARCRQLAGSMDLALAGIDLRRTPAGDWVCFEVNPSPAFTYFEAHTGQPIARGVAALLAGRQRVSGPPGSVAPATPPGLAASSRCAAPSPERPQEPAPCAAGRT